MNEEAIKLLYEDIKNSYDVGSLDEFKNYLLDDNKRKMFFDQVIKPKYDVNTIDDFESVYGLKKKDKLQPTSQKVVTESITEEEEIPTLSASLYEDDQDSEIAKKLEANTRRVGSSLSRIPLFLAEQVFTLLAPDDVKEKVNNLPAEQREGLLSSFISSSTPSVAGGGFIANITPELTQYYQEQTEKIKEIEDTYKKYDTSIGEDFSNLDIVQALDRSFVEIIGGAPQLIQAMVPGVGIASMVLGSAAEKSGELQREGEDLGLRTSLNSVVTGAAEGIFEVVTKKLGKKLLDSFKINPEETIKTLGTHLKELFIDANLEGGSEAATSIIQNLSDKLIQGRDVDFYDALRETIDSYIIGAGTGTTLTGTGKSVSTIKNIAQKSKLSRKIKDSKYDNLDDVFIPVTNNDGSVSDKTDIDQVTLDIASSPVSRKFVVDGLNKSVNSGKLTREEADKRLVDFDNIREANSKISDDIKGESRLKAVDLIREKKSIQKDIEGIDPALTKNKESRIQEINNELEQIANAIQEQTAGQVPVQPETAVSETVEEGTPKAESEVVTEEGIPQEIASLKDDESVLITVKTIDEVPQQFRDRARESSKTEIKTKKSFFGIPYGPTQKTEVGGGFTYTITGLEAKELATQELQKNAGPEVVTEQVTQEEVDTLAYKPEEVVETTDAAAFADSQAEAITQRKDDKLQVTPLTKDDAQNIIDEGGKLFITEDGKSGAYVTADGYMGGLFKQPEANRTQAAKVLQDARIQAGGKFFDAFGINTESGKGTTLEDIYIKNGFRPVARMTFNPEFAPDGWENTNLKNRPDNVFFVYDPTYKATKGEGQRIEDYDQAYELAKNFSPEAAEIESEVQTLRELFKEPEQRKQVENAEKALKAIAPDVKIVVHESEEAYARATNEQNRAQKTAGEYNPTTKTIHINPAKANARTVAHEAFHAILLSTVKTDAEAQRLTNAMMKAVAKVASPELKDYLDAFASNYDQNIRSEEKLAELVGKLASEYGSLPKPTQNIIKRWLDRLAKMFRLKPFTDSEVINVLNTIAKKVSTGEAITVDDIVVFNKQGSQGSVGVFKIARNQRQSPNPKNDSRPWVRELVDVVKIKDLEGEKFITNMYDFTTAGEVDLAEGLKMEFLGGRNYVPYMMNKTGKKMGDVSNLAAFNSKAAAEGFVNSSKQSGAKLFAPHIGTMEGSWQFQHHIFKSLVDIVLDNKLIPKSTLIKEWNDVISSKAGKELIDQFNSRNGTNLRTFNEFSSNPKELVGLLDIENNFSPKLRKALNDKLVGIKSLKEKLGLKNKMQILSKMIDPLNKGAESFDIMSIVEFDPNTFEIVKTKLTDPDHHPSFGWTVKSKINKILQPDYFYKSYDITDSYTKYNLDGTTVSKKTDFKDIKDFSSSNVSSSAGAIPKVAEFKSITRSRKQATGRPSIDNVIKIAKENNISDAAIRKFLQDDQGMTTKQADDAVKNYNEVQRRKGLKVEGVKDPSAITFFGKEVLSENNLKKMYQGLLFLKSARANQPKSMFIGKEDKAGAVEGAVKRAYNTLNKLDRITKKLSKKDLDNVMAELDSYLRGNKEAKLPDKIKKIAFEMRTHLDYLSKKLVEVGAVPDVSFDELSPKKKKELIEKAGSEAEAREDYKSAAENVLGNVGEYLNRSFAVHTDKNWKDKVSQKVVEDAKAYLRKSMAKSIEAKAIKENKDFASLLEQEVNAVVDRLLDPNESRSFFNTANASSKNTGILKQKQDIAPEILALMGEQTSPAMNYIISVQKIASLAAQQTFLNNVREKGLGVFLFENEADAPKGFRVKIASEGSKTMNPLNGMYTSPEIAKALNETYKKPEGIIKVVVDFINFLYLKPLGVVKYNKTILSPGTHSKNIIGNGFFMLANGYLNPKDWADAGIVVWNEIKSGDNDALNNKYIEYIEAGVINSSATLNDLKRTLSGIGNKVESEEEFERRVQDRLYGKNIIKKGLKGAEKAYQLEDDYFKIISYEVNKRQYAKALFKDSFENISDKQKQEVIEIAKEVTKNTLPNYERIAAIRDALKILPFGSNFLSFHMEALRTSYNTIDLAFKEINDPRTAAIGARRLAGISAVIMLSTGIIGTLLGGGDDEDEKDDAIRKLLPHWSENSNIRIVSTEGENIVYQDLSASSPYGAMEKAMNAYSRGEDISDSLKGTFDELFGAFYADDIIVSQVNKYTEVVSSQGFTSREGKEALARGLYETFKPGGLTSNEKIFIDDRMKLIDAAFGRKIELKKEGKVGEAVGQFSGYGNRIVKKNAVIKRKLYEIGSAGFGDFKSGKARSASTDYNNRYRDFLNGKVSEDEVEKAYDRSNLMYKEAMKEAIEIYKAALILDINYYDMVDIMKETGFSKKEIELIDIGETPELKRKGESDSLSPYQKFLKRKSKR